MDEINQLKHDLLKVTSELISPCGYCPDISTNPDSKTPISCTKLSGGNFPVLINVATCLSCGEFKKLRIN